MTKVHWPTMFTALVFVVLVIFAFKLTIGRRKGAAA